MNGVALPALGVHHIENPGKLSQALKLIAGSTLTLTLSSGLPGWSTKNTSLLPTFGMAKPKETLPDKFLQCSREWSSNRLNEFRPSRNWNYPALW
jgi:hypothetical protein